MPCSAIMSDSRFSPMPLQPISAWMSPSTCTGSRTLARTMRITLSSITPSTHQRQQRQEQPFVEDLPPVGRLAEAADVDHVRGAGEQRHQLAVVEGGRGDDDVVEMAGALPRIVGDVGITFGFIVSTGNSRMKWMTLRAIEFTWPGVPVTACASMRPSRSNTPAEMSPASRALVEKAVRTSARACSSTTESRRFHMTCSRMSAKGDLAGELGEVLMRGPPGRSGPLR